MNTDPKPVEILVLGAHPDDVELGCGGTIAKMTAAGRTVGIADLTGGEKGTRGSREARLKESHKAAKILGVAFRANLGIPDMEVSERPEFEKKLVTLFRTVRPRVVIGPYALHSHPDHLAGYNLIQAAWFKSAFGQYDSPLPAFRPERLVHYLQDNEVAPTFIVDISNEIEKRRRAIAAYPSQFHDPKAPPEAGKTRISAPHFMEGVETRLRFFGSKIYKAWGEPFYMREVPEISSPADLSDPTSVFK